MRLHSSHWEVLGSRGRLRKNSILPLVLKGHGFGRADKVNQISVGFSHRGTYFGIFGEIQTFPQPAQAKNVPSLSGLLVLV